MAYWLEQLLEVLRDFYPPDGPEGVIGYLKGTDDPNTWRLMAVQRKPQFLILGSTPPTQQEWVDAGKPYREPIRTVRREHLDGLIILYAGGSPRPWGRIETLDDDAIKYYQDSTINPIRRNFPKRRD